MKLIISTIAIAMIGTASIAETKVINGCEVRKAENGNYFSRVNPACGIELSTASDNQERQDRVFADLADRLDRARK